MFAQAPIRLAENLIAALTALSPPEKRCRHKETYSGFYKSKPKQLIQLPVSATAEEISNGQLLYNANCRTCHGWMGDNGGSIPNLTYSSEGTFEILEDIVLKGMYLKKGMPNFSDRLKEKDVNDIKNYILHSANELRSEKN